MYTKFYDYIKEEAKSTITLYHGTSSNCLESIKNKKETKLFLTTDEEVAIYYAAMGGENYFLEKEEEFEKEYNTTPQDYYDTDENGESEMFKALYPKDEYPVVIKFEIPKHLINNLSDFFGYKGGELTIVPAYISDVINISWDDLDF